MTSQKNHYDTLGITENATKKEIRDSFIELSKNWHPDKDPLDSKRHAKFVEINEAYKILSNPETRNVYNLRLHRRRMYGNIKHEGYDIRTKEPRWQDPSFWEFRDKSKDKYRNFEEDFYYGIKGIKRVHNGWIAAGAVGLMLFGTLLHFIAARTVAARLSESNKVNERRLVHKLYMAREAARKNGNQRQTELFLKASQDKEELKP